MNKLIIPIIAVLIIAAGIGGYFVSRKSASPEINSEAKRNIPYYFIAIHNEPHNSEPGSREKIDQGYATLKEMVRKANEYNIKLTLMFTPQWADYISENSERMAELESWKKHGHEIAAHHHSIYHGNWDGYTDYTKKEAETQRIKQGKTPEEYLGTFNDYIDKLKKLNQNIHSGCVNEEHDKAEMPDEIIYGTCSGFANYGEPGRRESDAQNLDKGKNEFITVGNYKGIQRKWLTHYQTNNEVETAKKVVASMKGGVWGSVFHSNKRESVSFYAFLEFLHSIDSAGAKSKTVSQIIDQKLIPEKIISDDLLNEKSTIIGQPSSSGKCGDGICDEKEKANPELCPKDCGFLIGSERCGAENNGYCIDWKEKCKEGYEGIGPDKCRRGRSAQCCMPATPSEPKTEPETNKKCSELKGNVCSSSQTCSGSWLSASDTDKCCSGECKTSSTPPPPPTSSFSPFGIMAAFDASTLTSISASDKIAWVGEKFRDIGAKWSKEHVIWGLIEPEFGQGYDWSESDEAFKRVYQNGGENFNIVVVVIPQRVRGGSSDIPLDKENYFSNFVETLVERYDGDGINDYDPIIKVEYWQMANEPFPRHWEEAGGTIDGYVRFTELTYKAIKKSDSDAKIILGTFQLETTEQVNKFKEVIPKMKNKNLFDYVDTHYWNSRSNYKIPVGEARSVLDSNGYLNATMVALEFGTWAEMSGRGTEKDQANYLIKGYAYNIAHGFALINWNNLVEWNNFGGKPKSIYNFMGLIADGLNGDPVPAGTERISYYTYKKMVEVLEGSDWNNIQTIQESGSVYVYKFNKSGKNIWVAWNDNSVEKQITISGITSSQVKITEAVPKYESGKDVTDFNTAFETETKTAQNNKISITLGDVPVFVEKQ